MSWSANSKRTKIWGSTGFRCVYCGGTAPIRKGQAPAVNYRTVDHIIPKSHGGGRFEENLLPACFACNSARDHHWPPSERVHRDFRAMVRKMEETLLRMPLTPDARRWIDRENAKAAKRRNAAAWAAVDAMTPEGA